jgi:hypothetical protein
VLQKEAGRFLETEDDASSGAGVKMNRKLSPEETDKKEFHDARNEIYGWFRECNCSGKVEFYEISGEVSVIIDYLFAEDIKSVGDFINRSPKRVGKFRIIGYDIRKRKKQDEQG